MTSASTDRNGGLHLPGLALLLLVAIFAGLFFQHRLFMLVNDDFTYVTSATLWPLYTPYTELPFIQMPLVLWVHATVAALAGAANAYQAISLFNAALAFAACAGLAFLAAGKKPLSLLVFLALIASPPVLMTAWATSNHALQLALAVALATLLLKRRPEEPGAGLAVGIVLGLLLSAKLNSLPFGLPVVVWLWRSPLRSWIIVSLATLAALAPALATILPRLQDFIFDTMTVIFVSNTYRGFTWANFPPAFAKLLGQAVFSPFMALLALCAVFSKPVGRVNPILAALLVAGFVAALIPGVAFHYHLALFEAMLALALGYTLKNSSLPERFHLLALPVLALACFFAFQTYLSQPVFRSGETRFGVVAETSAAYLVALEQAKASHALCASGIFSDAALPALGGPLPLVAASAGGPFLIRLYDQQDKVPPHLRHFFDAASILDGKTALLTGYHYGLAFEPVLVATAQAKGYRAMPLGMHFAYKDRHDWTLWLPPCPG